MTSMIRLALLASLGSLLLVVTDVSQAYQLRQGAYMNVNLGGIYGKQHTCPRRKDHLPENCGRRDTSAGGNFKNRFRIH